MRFWGPNIRISGEWVLYSAEKSNDNLVKTKNKQAQEKFEVDTQDVLRTISKNIVGKSVLDAFTNSPNGVTIRPLTPEAIDKTGAVAILDKLAFESAQGYRGSGTDSTIWFDPGSWSQPVNGHLYRVDDTLLHECVHSLRQARGLWHPVKVPDFDDLEEMIATMLTNIYCANLGRAGDMRGDHKKGFTGMSKTEDEFQVAFHEQLSDFLLKMADVHNPVCKVGPSWNPLRIAERNWRIFHP